MKGALDGIKTIGKNEKTLINSNILIIGAGPAGLSAAMRLSKENETFVIIEKNGYVGGLAKTFVFKEEGLEYRTDIGPHRLYSENQYHYDFLEDALQEKMITVKRKTSQFINGQYFDYPINAFQTFRNLGLPIILKILYDYLGSLIRYRILKKPISNFYDYALANFGKTLAYYNIINYTEKIWGVQTQSLSEEWAKKRIKGLNVSEIIIDKLKKISNQDKSNIKTMIETFYYPEYGAGTIYDAMQNQLTETGHKIYLNSYPTKIIHEENKIKGVESFIDGIDKYIKCDFLVESIHISDFVKLFDPLPPTNILEAASKLRYRSQVYLFIIIDKERIFEDQWIYFPDPSIPFARITEMKNFSLKMSPKYKTSLFIEFFCNEGDRIHIMAKEDLLDLATPHLEALGFLKREDIINYYKIAGGKDYPIFDTAYKQNLEPIIKYLESFRNLFYIGRPGRFAYTSQDESIEMGLIAANKIIEEKRTQQNFH